MKTAWFLCAVGMSMVLLSGCAITKWECAYGNCIDRERAINKCLAQCNSAFANRAVKSSIWEQCMRGEGFQEVKCEQYEYNRDHCKPMGLHVF
jgi:hypothetical protein